jgi:HD superfamily phosphodiesterase
MMTDYIKDWVKCKCNKIQNELGSAFFEQHILIVKEYACRLADILGADQEIVEISSYLHDISAVMDINTLSQHSHLSAETAEFILKERSYDSDKIEVGTIG